MAKRFASSDVERLPLSDGDWIEVKAELSVGDTRRMHAYSAKNVKRTDDGISYELDVEKLPAARTLAYLVDWSFRDESGKRVPVSESAIAALTPDTATEIDAAILAYEVAQQGKK